MTPHTGGCCWGTLSDLTLTLSNIKYLRQQGRHYYHGCIWSNDIPPYDYSQRQELWLKIVADISTGQLMYRGLYNSRNLSQFLTLSPSSSRYHHLSLFPTFYSCCNSNEYERQNQTRWEKTKWVTNKRWIYHTERRIAWIICRNVQNS